MLACGRDFCGFGFAPEEPGACGGRCGFMLVLLRKLYRLRLLRAELHAQRATSRSDRKVLITKPPHQVEGLSWWLLERKAERVLLDALFDRLPHVREMPGDVVERRWILLAERRIVQQLAEETHEIALIGGDDVLQCRADRAVCARRRELELLGRELAAAFDELSRRPRVVKHLAM